MSVVAATAPGAAQALLEVRALRAGYGASEVLHGVDLHVGPGEVVALLGRNGMGKTTLWCAPNHRARPGARRRDPLRRCARRGRAAASHRAARHRPGARGPAGVRQPDGAGTSERVRAGARGRWQQRGPAKAARPSASDASSEPLSAPARVPPPSRQPAFGRRAADARDSARPRHRAAPPDPRRGDRRPGAARAPGDLALPGRTRRAGGQAILVIDKHVQRLIGLGQQDRHVILEKGRVAWTGGTSPRKGRADDLAGLSRRSERRTVRLAAAFRIGVHRAGSAAAR